MKKPQKPKIRKTVDRPRMEAAVREFLLAAGIDLQLADLLETPQRVTDAWADEFLAGYQSTARQALSERFSVDRSSDRSLVVVTDIRFRSMCPHHLLPYSGHVHLAYLPKGEIVGFGRLSALIDVFAHRLILQEQLAVQIVDALMTELNCAGAACAIDAEQSCFRLRGQEQHEAVTHSDAYAGVLSDGDLRREFWLRIGARR